MCGRRVTLRTRTSLCYLDPAVAPIGYDDVSVDVDRDARGSVELAVSFPVGAELQEQVPLRGENLRKRGSERVESAVSVEARPV